MLERKKKEAAIKLMRGISDWDPSEPCAFEMSAGAEFRAGPVSCVTVGGRHRLLIMGMDYTQEMSDALGLGLRSEPEDGARHRTFASSPERELVSFVLALGREELVAPADESDIARAVRSGALKSRLLASALGFVGYSSSKSPDGSYERDLARGMRSAQADCSLWSLNRKGFERALMEIAPQWVEGFYEELGQASARALMDLARMAHEPEWWHRKSQSAALARRLAGMGCALSQGRERAADLFEAAGHGEAAALLQALELRESLPLRAPAPSKAAASL